MTATEFAASYRSYRDLPPLAGLGSFAEGMKPGMSVEESVRRLKRLHYAFKRLHQIFISRIAAEPLYELKMAFSYHAYLCAEQVSAIRARVGEMREPPLGLEAVPHAGLEMAFDDLLASHSTLELLPGIYEVALPALQAALERYTRDAHLLADQPSRRLCRHALSDVQEMLDYGRKAIAALEISKEREASREHIDRISRAFAAAGDLDGTRPEGPLPERPASNGSFKYDGVPRRDERFLDPYNMGVNAEVFLYDPEACLDGKVLMMFYKRLREIDVPEVMSSIIAETSGKPWAYYRDMTRQLWDEARHAMMGELGFASVGVDWPRNVMVNFTWSLGLNTQLTPKERHAVLYFIEQGLMTKTGKRHEWEVGVQSRNALAATFQDFDWADEVLHARIGREWYVNDMPSPTEAVAYGDQCWSKVLMNWETWRQRGLTQHRNWWPDTYRQFCERNGVQPDPNALAYATTYQETRADLRSVSGSA